MEEIADSLIRLIPLFFSAYSANSAVRKAYIKRATPA